MVSTHGKDVKSVREEFQARTSVEGGHGVKREPSRPGRKMNDEERGKREEDGRPGGIYTRPVLTEYCVCETGNCFASPLPRCKATSELLSITGNWQSLPLRVMFDGESHDNSVDNWEKHHPTADI